MIIIKSQDGKSVRKYDGVNIDYANSKKIIAQTALDMGEKSVYSLGTYESEERAKEVMAMIEVHICDLYADKCIMNEVSLDAFSPPILELIDRIKMESKKYIFKMPKG